MFFGSLDILGESIYSRDVNRRGKNNTCFFFPLAISCHLCRLSRRRAWPFTHCLWHPRVLGFSVFQLFLEFLQTPLVILEFFVFQRFLGCFSTSPNPKRLLLRHRSFRIASTGWRSTPRPEPVPRRGPSFAGALAERNKKPLGDPVYPVYNPVCSPKRSCFFFKALEEAKELTNTFKPPESQFIP